MKNVLNHMTSCTAGKSCSMPHCSSSRQIIAHWKHCNRPDCPVCLPLKQSDHSRGRQQPGGAGGAGANGPNTGPGNGGNGPAGNLLPGGQHPVNTSQPNNGPQQQQQNQQNSLPMLLSPQNNAQQGGMQQQGNNPVSSSTGGGNPATNPSPGPSDESMKKAFAALGLPPTGQFQPQPQQGGVRPQQQRMPGPNNQQQQQQAPGQQPQMRLNVPNAPGGGFRPLGLAATSSPSQLAIELMEGQGDPVRLPNNLSTVSATPMPSVKEWHGAVTSDLRNHLVHKL